MLPLSYEGDQPLLWLWLGSAQSANGRGCRGTGVVPHFPPVLIGTMSAPAFIRFRS